MEKMNKTSYYELATGHSYRGKLALFGESVMFKRLVKYKASDLFERGVWVGKHSWNDNHIVLSPEGAFEARTIRRLASEEAFIATGKGTAVELQPARNSDEARWTSAKVPAANP